MSHVESRSKPLCMSDLLQLRVPVTGCAPGLALVGAQRGDVDVDADRLGDPA